jgi:glycosyltransferase involved in cell wall biosynthesis
MEKIETKKITLGISIPYWKNTSACEVRFKELMAKIEKQITRDMLLCVYEDGQVSDWLLEYKKNLGDKMILIQNPVNYGVSVARNKTLDELVDKCLYVLFLDSDDEIADDYLKVMKRYCFDNSHEVIESKFAVNKRSAKFDKNLLRCGVAGSAIQTKIIGKKRFDETLQIGEDTKFMRDVVDLKKHRKKLAPTEYNYLLGTNEQSLTMRYERKQIGRYR